MRISLVCILACEFLKIFQIFRFDVDADLRLGSSRVSKELGVSWHPVAAYFECYIPSAQIGIVAFGSEDYSILVNTTFLSRRD